MPLIIAVTSDGDEKDWRSTKRWWDDGDTNDDDGSHNGGAADDRDDCGCDEGVHIEGRTDY